MAVSFEGKDLVVHAGAIDGTLIRSIDDWKQHAGPVGGAAHWQDYRSAKELAVSWFRSGSLTMPVEYTELLNQCNLTAEFQPSFGIAEMKIRLDEFPGPRNSDLVVVGTSKGQTVLLAIEAKADEEFAGLIGDELKGLPNDSNKPERIERLANAVFKSPINDHVKNLRYQLLHSLAATAIEAKKQNASVGVLLIHEFISLPLDFEKVTRNANDLKAFVQSVPDWRDAQLTTGKLLPPIPLYKTEDCPSGQLVTIGKVRTLLPLNSGNRKQPLAGYSTSTRQYLDNPSPES